MKKFNYKLTLLFFILSFYGFAQNIHKLDSVFTQMYNKGEFNGNVIISKKGTILLKKSYGYSDREKKEPLTDNSIFNLASITKQFTAAAIVLLDRKGKLSYDDEITKYIPELDFYPKITIKNLLTHTSGLPDYMAFTDEVAIQKDSTILLNNDLVIELYKKYQPELNFQPDSKFEYSNTGYFLLATIIEKVSKQSYSNFLQEHIFNPLKMNSTKVLYRYTQYIEDKNLTNSYQESESGDILDALEAAPAIRNYDLVKGQGRLYSTTLDLHKWSNALSHNFFNISEWNLICQEGFTEDKEQRNYGFGWFLTQDIINGKSIYHSGSWPGYITYIEKNIKEDITLIMLQNVSTTKSYLPTFLLRKYLYNNPDIILESDYLKSLAGEYETHSGQTKSFVYENHKLHAVMNSNFKLELIPRTKYIFKVDGFSPEVNFEFVFENNTLKGYNFYQLDVGMKTYVKKKQQTSITIKNQNTMKTLLEKYYKGFAQKKGWEPLISEDFKFTIDSMKDVNFNEGKDTYIEIMKRFSKVYQTVRIKKIIIDGNNASVIANYDYIFPNGKQMSGDVAEFWTIKDGKLDSLHIFCDTLTFYENTPKG